MTLTWNSREYTLNPEFNDIGEVYEGISNGLSNAGYAGVRITDFHDGRKDLQGKKGDLSVAVFYLRKGQTQTFWQVIVCGGSGSADQASAEVAEVQDIIDNLQAPD